MWYNLEKVGDSNMKEKSNFKLEVYIGGGYSFRNKESVACVFIPTFDGIYIPGHQVAKEFETIHQAGTYVADFYDFYNEYIIKEVCPKFVVEIHLNVKSNKKTFYGEEAINAIDRIEAKYTKELRDF